MTIKLVNVQFVNIVSFGGQLQSLSVNPSGERPGEKPNEISFDPESSLVEIKRVVNGVPKTKYSPLSNVASFEPAPVEAKKVEVKK
jgi:hypothetical protein